MKKLLHWLGFHEWFLIRMYNYNDTSFGHKALSTAIFKGCACGAFKKDLRYGEVWSKEDLAKVGLKKKI